MKFVKIKGIKDFLKSIFTKKVLFWVLIGFLVFSGLFAIWVANMDIPDISSFEQRKVPESTKIYDRTGEVVLYDVHGNIQRTVVPLDEISDHLKNASIAIEDQDFYSHGGIQISAIFRAIFKNLSQGNPLSGQGGSTITQQVVKNTLLTGEKKVSRKIKEWILAMKLERILEKDEILEIYLNEVPYGGSVYGVQEASQRFFGKDAKEVDYVEAAYIAALPKAPTYYSPYGNHRDKLEERKNFVLKQMEKNNFITENQYEEGVDRFIDFKSPEKYGIKAPHFVMYVIEQLEEKYGEETVEQGGLKVITTLDWELQERAEEVALEYGLKNKEDFEAENASITAMDPRTGEILVMVGSRDYFDEEIEGNFNITTTHRQPGSTFKPIVYAEAFNKGYRPETVVFDVQTEFSATCDFGGDCYKPVNYDGVYHGPISLRNALAQSINVPAVKTFYLAGREDALNLAKDMGITSLTDIERYGLTLVLGGGEVSPLDLTTAYGVFANGGIRHKQHSIIKVEDKRGEILEEIEMDDDGNFKEKGERVLPENTAFLISDVLTDNAARTPAFGSNSWLYVPQQDVAVKTGTTNDYRDAWIIGYTPNLVVTSWAGNNDNRSMVKKVAGFVVAPMWREFVDFALEKRDVENFPEPAPFDNENVKPIIAGVWNSSLIQNRDNVEDEEFDQNEDSDNGSDTSQFQQQQQQQGIHSILHFVRKEDPNGPYPLNPGQDPQYRLWEAGVQQWLFTQGIGLVQGLQTENREEKNEESQEDSQNQNEEEEN